MRALHSACWADRQQVPRALRQVRSAHLGPGRHRGRSPGWPAHLLQVHFACGSVWVIFRRHVHELHLLLRHLWAAREALQPGRAARVNALEAVGCGPALRCQWSSTASTVRTVMAGTPRVILGMILGMGVLGVILVILERFEERDRGEGRCSAHAFAKGRLLAEDAIMRLCHTGGMRASPAPVACVGCMGARVRVLRVKL